MGVLSSIICSLSTFYPESLNPSRSPKEAKNLTILRLLGKVANFSSLVL
jgi:citrate synthase